MANGKFVAYYRVSTAKQGASRLGLEAQQEAVRSYLNGGRWKMVDEVTEVESGKRNDRPALASALALCRIHKATLIIAKLDSSPATSTSSRTWWSQALSSRQWISRRRIGSRFTSWQRSLSMRPP